MNYRAAKQYILEELDRDLSPLLFYHGVHHTKDVLRMATSIGKREGVKGRDMILLKTAALYHDAGFLKNKHAGHEEEGCRIAQMELPRFEYSPEEVHTICGMIMATKIPQSPHNLLEEIICDADLDYLGREDFYHIGSTLFKELQAYQLIGDFESWNRLQVSFLSAHHFHTDTNHRLREPVKTHYLQELRDLVASY
jgi:hypothetical protein